MLHFHSSLYNCRFGTFINELVAKMVHTCCPIKISILFNRYYVWIRMLPSYCREKAGNCLIPLQVPGFHSGKTQAVYIVRKHHFMTSKKRQFVKK